MKTQKNWLRFISLALFASLVATVFALAFASNYVDNLIRKNSNPEQVVKIWVPKAPPGKVTVRTTEGLAQPQDSFIMTMEGFKKAFATSEVFVTPFNGRVHYTAFMNGVRFNSEDEYSVSDGDSATYVGNGFVRLQGIDVGIVHNALASLAIALFCAAVTVIAYGFFHFLVLEWACLRIDRKIFWARAEGLKKALVPA